MKRIIKITIMMIFVLIIQIDLFANDSTSIPIEFTDDEQAFIAEHPTIKLGIDPNFMPYEFIDSDENYKGIAADYIQLLSQKIGIQMVVEPDKTWSEAYELTVEKKVDVLPCVSKTTERQQYFLFSEPYFTVQRVIVVQENNTTIKNIEDLKYTSVAVQKKSSHYSYLKNIPEIYLNLYSTPEEALVAVSKGYEKSFIGNLATSAYFIKSNGLTGLKYVTLGAEEDQQYLYFAVRNDWPLLVSIINKGLSSITIEEAMVISDKWIGLKNQIDYSRIIIIAAIVGGIILLIFMISIYWILRLKKEIAKRTLIEEELRKAKVDAENTNNVKSTFLARMSHEIRTPLNAITGMAYLIKKSEITSMQKMYVDKIIEAAHTMLNVINDILDFSKIESGKVEIENSAFNLDKMIQQVVSIISFKIEEQGILFSFKKDPQIPTNFFGDSKRIEQILLNLLSNAVKFSKDGEVSLNIRLISQEDNLYHLEFAVQDSGIGLSEAQIAQLFKPFVQADSSINRRFGGTGLGLSIVKNFVDLMHGEIHVDSIEGKRSTFIIQLPLLVDDSQDFKEIRNTATAYLQEVRILALLKNNSLINVIETYLLSFGIHAEFTKSPPSAHLLLEEIHATEKTPYNLFIIDYDVLAEQSFEFAKNILDDPKIRSKPKIIMLIPMVRKDLYEKIELYGLNLGIAKPVIPSVLFNGIMEIFKKNDLKSSINNQISKRGEERRAAKNYKVLVVEDNKTNQFIAKSILEQVGVSVLLADNGEEGAAYYIQHISEINLILMDLHMPVLNGYDAAIRIREHNQDVPIVAMTADAIIGVEEKCKSVGIYHYISKPFEPEKFIETILRLLDQCENTSLDSQPSPQTEINKEIENARQKDPLTNQEAALRLLGQNKQLYHMVLEKYIQENSSTCEALEQEMQNKNYSQAAQIVHKVKGSSGNIGAQKLYEAAIVLQKALENSKKEEISELYPKFNRLLTKSLEEIKGIRDYLKSTL